MDGGEGRFGGYFSEINVELTYYNLGILSMHSTLDAAAKADLRGLHEGFAFFKR